MESWNLQHDALYLHLAIACIDGGINPAERRALADMLPIYVPDPAEQSAAFIKVTQQLLQIDDALVIFYQGCCARLLEAYSQLERVDLLASMHRVAVADDRKLNPAEVVLLRMAIVLLDIAEAASISSSGRFVRRFVPVAITA